MLELKPALGTRQRRNIQQLRSIRRYFGPLTVLGLAWAAGPGCSRSLDEQECEQLLDRYTAQLLREEHPEASAQLVADKQRAARELARSKGVYEFHECPNRVSRRQFQCAMTADNLDGMERCLL